MSRGVRILLGAQFLTAFADNAILWTAIEMLEESPRGSEASTSAWTAG